jgi:hypothetical protein
MNTKIQWNLSTLPTHPSAHNPKYLRKCYRFSLDRNHWNGIHFHIDLLLHHEIFLSKGQTLKYNIKTNTFNICKRVLGFLIFCSCAFSFPTGVFAEDLSSPEYAIKVAFLYNFRKYVEWPAPSSSDISPAAFRICIQGMDPFGNDLKELEGKTVGSHIIRVDHIDLLRGEEAFQYCHILFISRSEKDALPAIFEKLEGQPVLTVTDLNDTSNSRAIINLITLGDKVRFEINLEPAKRAGIKVSSQLLKLATKVTE